MVSASFLVKQLGIHWRRGECHIARELLDYDLAVNHGGWQWSASTGCDARPWFRTFSPVAQSRHFDPRGAYIRRGLTDLARVPPALTHTPWQMAAHEPRAARCVIGRDYPAPASIMPSRGARRSCASRPSVRDEHGTPLAARCRRPRCVRRRVPRNLCDQRLDHRAKRRNLVPGAAKALFQPARLVVRAGVDVAVPRDRDRRLAHVVQGRPRRCAGCNDLLRPSARAEPRVVVSLLRRPHDRRRPAKIVVLLVAIAVNAGLFRPIDRVAAWLLAPYAAWVAFAAVLNFEL
jgi:hypothetical protein